MATLTRARVEARKAELVRDAETLLTGILEAGRETTPAEHARINGVIGRLKSMNEWLRIEAEKQDEARAASRPALLERVDIGRERIIAAAVAFHEAGHAVIATLDGIAIEKVWLSFDEDGRSDGGAIKCAATPAVLLAGELAVQLAGLGHVLPHSSNRGDHESLKKYNVSNARLAELRANTRFRLEMNMHRVRAVAARLVERGRLSGREVVAIVNTAR